MSRTVAAPRVDATAPSIFDALPTTRIRRAGNGSDRRVHTRLAPPDLESPISARLKYGDAVTLVDLSVGGALVETSMMLRPDTDLVLELVDARTRNVTDVVSRVLRAQVSALHGGIKYRGACVFDRPFAHPALATARPPLTQAIDSRQLELALKTIVEGFFRRPTSSSAAGRWRDGSALIDALVRLRSAAERGDHPVDRQIAQLLATIIPGLQRQETVESVLGRLHDRLSRHLPLLAIRTASPSETPSCDRERVTMSMCTGAGDPPIAVTAEFTPGFGLDAGQFRLLKATAYLVGLVGHWCPAGTDAATAHAAVADACSSLSAPTTEHQDLPIGWQRIVVRCVSGQLLRGYSNDFHPDRAHLHLCPSVACSAAERLLVPMMRLKAVFFVKDLQGNPDRVDGNAFDHRPRGRKVEVKFRDGEVMIGSTLSYKPDGRGFFLQPANSQGNNLRIYIVNAAIRHMRFL